MGCVFGFVVLGFVVDICCWICVLLLIAGQCVGLCGGTCFGYIVAVNCVVDGLCLRFMFGGGCFGLLC